MGGSGSSSGKGGSSGGAGGASNMTQAQRQRTIAENEAKINSLERELEEEMSTSKEKSRHSVGWRREMQNRIRELRDENTFLKYGKRERTTRY